MTVPQQQDQQRSLARIDEWEPNDVVAQVRKIQQVMTQVMRKDEHFGVIPGTGDKPSLYKPGAEKLALTFRLAPRYDVTTEHQGIHRIHTVRCSLTHIPSGQFVGEGVGVGSTLESKYRYRQEVVGRSIPEEYWRTRDESLLGAGNKVQKRGGNWVIVRRVENPDVADQYNTVLKMAKKRAFVDAVLSATAASDLFTQDVEDLPKEHDDSSSASAPPSTPPAAGPSRASSPPKPAAKKAAKKKTTRKQAPPQQNHLVTEDEAEEANAISKETLTVGQNKMIWAITFSTVDKAIHGEYGPADFVKFAVGRVLKLREDTVSIKALTKEQAKRFLDVYNDDDSRNEMFEEWQAREEANDEAVKKGEHLTTSTASSDAQWEDNDEYDEPEDVPF